MWNTENAEGKLIKLDPKKEGLELAKMEGRHQKKEDEKNREKDQRAMKKLFKENAPLAVSKIAADNVPPLCTALRRSAPLCAAVCLCRCLHRRCRTWSWKIL